MQSWPWECTRSCPIVRRMTTQQNNSKNRNRLTSAVLSVMVLIASVGMTAPAANATAWDPHVALTGRATCSPSPLAQVTWMWVTASNGEQGWATLSGSPSNTRSYRFDFYKVGTGGTTVTVQWGCSGMTQTRKFGINRPLIGSYTTVNLCPNYWTGPCF